MSGQAGIRRQELEELREELAEWKEAAFRAGRMADRYSEDYRASLRPPKPYRQLDELLAAFHGYFP